MSRSTPSLIALYAFGSGRRERVAEFTLNPDGTVSLTVSDPSEGQLAQDYYNHGVELVSEGRTVGPDDGAAFMRALMQPFRMSYFSFIDESPSE